MPLFLIIEQNDIRLQTTPAEWKQLTASHLGTGAVGDGTKYLADDLTWKTITGGSGSTQGVDIDCGTFTEPNSMVDVDLNKILPVLVTYGEF